MGVRERLANAPSWVPYAFQGVFFAAWMNITEDRHHAAARSLLITAGAAVVFGSWMWFAERGARREAAAFTAGLSQESRRVVWRAYRTGTPPADPMLREIALAMCRYRMQNHLNNRRRLAIMWSVLLGVWVIFALTADGTPWRDYLGIAVLAWVLYDLLRFRGNLQKRMASLQGPYPATA